MVERQLLLIPWAFRYVSMNLFKAFGPDVTVVFSHQILPSTLHVMGRIAHVQVWDYIDKLQTSSSRVSAHAYCTCVITLALDNTYISRMLLYGLYSEGHINVFSLYSFLTLTAKLLQIYHVCFCRALTNIKQCK